MVTRLIGLALACALGACAPRPDPRLLSGADGGSVLRAGRQPPARPTIADSTDGPIVAFGLREIFLDQGREAENIGLDIDGYVTVPSDLGGECDNTSTRPVDGPDGIDNIVGSALYPLFETVSAGIEARWRTAADAGHDVVVVRITGWNGTPNDPRIDVAIASSVFCTAVDGPTGDEPPAVTIRSPTDYELAGGAPLPAPVWDGGDWTWVREDGFLGGDPGMPVVRDELAYVVDGVFVARLPAPVELGLVDGMGGLLIRLTDATMFGALDTIGAPITVTGRWSVTDILDTAGLLGICPGSAQAGLLAGQLNRVADVRSVAPAPEMPGLTCDALSVGMTFRSTRVRVAGVTPGRSLVDLCAP